MTHLWIRAEERPNEKRVGVTPNGVKSLLQAGFDVTIERDSTRAISIESYSGAQVAGTGDWRSAPKEAIIIGLKELPEEITPLHHRHIMFGHAFKDQPDGQKLLERFQTGSGPYYFNFIIFSKFYVFYKSCIIQIGPASLSSLNKTLASTSPTPGRAIMRRRNILSKSEMSRATTRKR